MKSLSTSGLLLAIAFGISVSVASPACSQQNEPSIGLEIPRTRPQEVVDELPFETDLDLQETVVESTPLPEPTALREPTALPAVDEITSTYHSNVVDCETCEGNVVLDDNLFPEVKNVNFFGVDRERCCDEWEGLCKCKSLDYGCNCGGLKAKKGHLGIRWLKSKYGADDCDFCQGGCCEKGCRGIREERRKALQKLCPRKSKSCSCQNQNVRETFLGRPVKNSCNQCGCCEDCPPEEKCNSCR